MKRIGNLFDHFCSWPNLISAWRKASRGSRKNRKTAHFFYHLEPELFHLREKLLSGAWQPQPYRYFEIFDPKQRTISVAAFQDRIVHHAVVNILGPIYENRFIYDSYATRPEKGCHAAVLRSQQFLKECRWFFKSDIKKYFDSISHELLILQLARTIKDKPLLEILDKIIRNAGQSGIGLPIGNLTSQFFANVYLHPFDLYLKQELQVKRYIRYMDDFVLFHTDKEKLKEAKFRAVDFLNSRLQLEINPKGSFFNSSANGLSFLGKRIFPGVIRFHPTNLKRITKRLSIQENRWNKGYLTDREFISRVNAYWNMLSYYPAAGLRKSLLK